MSIRMLSVAAIQLPAHDRTSFEAAWPGVLACVRSAGERGAKLVVLPEGTIPGYIMGNEPFDGHSTDRSLEELSLLARSFAMVIVVGAIRSDGERTFNSAAVLDADGSIAGFADKQFLWGFDRQWFAIGERIEAIETAVGRLGALVCGDVRIPTIAATLVEKGAELLVMPTAWVTSGRDPKDIENPLADFLVRVRARENGVPFIAANKFGVERGCVAYCGKTQIVDANGSLLEIAPQDRGMVVTAQITLGRRLALSRHTPIEVANQTQNREQLRIAFTANEAIGLHDERLQFLDCDMFVQPGFGGDGEDSSIVPTFVAGDEVMLDPYGLVPYRRAGYQLIVWKSAIEPDWQKLVARTRATELHLYIVVLDARSPHAFAIDVDGNIVAGTFNGYEIAYFVLDGWRAIETTVAPGTNILDGIERAEQAK